MHADILPKNISISRFNELLSRYSPLIKSIANSSSSKPGQPSLLELDEFRYMKATEACRSQKPKRHMNHEDVKTLVNWKLRHGKFRPTLMNLVSSNDAQVVEKTIREAMTKYWADKDVKKATDAIAKLKGIGPATASLLLSVHDPERVIFFSDEAFWWLCCNGQKSGIKYNAKEYQQLNTAADELAKRLEVGATDIEKVAYVAMKDSSVPESADAPSLTQEQSKPSEADNEPADNTVQRRAPAKRKATSSDADSDNRPLRRSRRQKTSS